MKRLFVSLLVIYANGCGTESPTTMEDTAEIVAQPEELQAHPNFFKCLEPALCLTAAQCGIESALQIAGLPQCGVNKFCCTSPGAIP